MLEGTSLNVRKKVLRELTISLMKNSRVGVMYKLDEILKERDQFHRKVILPTKKEIEFNVKKKFDEVRNRSKDVFHEHTFKVEEKKKRPVSKPLPKKITVPRSPPVNYSENLPPTLSGLRPVRTNQEIDLGKLNILIKDRNVRTIELNGENEPVFVTGSMGKKPTNIKLSSDEIEEVINRFSIEAKIPRTSGLYKVAIGNLVLTAMTSENVGSRFFIKKI